MSKGVVISFFNQKGGVGKTTLTATIATAIHAYFPELKVAGLDVDSIQQSLTQLREYDNVIIKSSEYHKEISEKYGVYPIEVASPKEASQKIIELKEKVNLVFIDVPGTLLNEDLSKILLHIDYFIIPSYTDSLTLDATLEFLKILEDLEEMNKKNEVSANIKDKIVLLNRYNKRYDNIPNNKFIQTEEIIKEHGFSVLQNKIYERISLENERSTIFPIPHVNDPANIYSTIKEILVFINLIEN